MTGPSSSRHLKKKGAQVSTVNEEMNESRIHVKITSLVIELTAKQKRKYCKIIIVRLTVRVSGGPAIYHGMSIVTSRRTGQPVSERRTWNTIAIYNYYLLGVRWASSGTCALSHSAGIRVLMSIK